MKTLTGVCKYCGQTRTVEVADSADPKREELNEIATEECDCKEADIERNRKAMIEKATEEVNQYTENACEPAAGRILMAAMEEVVNHRVGMVTVKVSKTVSYRMGMSKNNGLIVERNEKISDDVTA